MGCEHISLVNAVCPSEFPRTFTQVKILVRSSLNNHFNKSCRSPSEQMRADIICETAQPLAYHSFNTSSRSFSSAIRFQPCSSFLSTTSLLYIFSLIFILPLSYQALSTILNPLYSCYHLECQPESHRGAKTKPLFILMTRMSMELWVYHRTKFQLHCSFHRFIPNIYLTQPMEHTT